MKKLTYAIAAVCTIAIAAPSIASAETVVIRHHDHMNRDRGLHRDHAWHRDHGWRHHDKTVVIKSRRHEG